MNPVENDLFIRRTFRVMVAYGASLTALASALLGFILFHIGFEYWWLDFVVTLLCFNVIYATRRKTPFPWFLSGLILLCLMIFGMITFHTIKLGNVECFHFPLVALIPLIMISGRIKLFTKTMLTVFVIAFFLYLDFLPGFEPDVNPYFNNVPSLRFVNLFITSLAMAGLSYRYFRIIVAQQESLSKAATTDHLTGLFNRRYMKEAGERMVATYERYGTPFAILLCDIDYFKRVNDQYGHKAGDQVLQFVSYILRNLARSSDHVARWGGEEFLLFLPESDKDGALLLAERLCKALASQSAIPEMNQLRVTMSVGVAIFKEKETLESAISRADAALYEAKETGRNRVVFKD